MSVANSVAKAIETTGNTTEVRWVAIGTHDFLSAGSGEVVQLLIRQGPTGTTLVIGETDERPDLHEVSGELALDVIRAVKDRGLEMPEALLAAGIGPPDLALIVLGEAPLATAAGDTFLQGFLGAVPAQTIGVIGLVHPVIHGPDQTALLVLEIAALRSADEPGLLGIGDAVAVGVTVDEDVEGVGLVDEHAVVERQDHARQDHLVAEEDVLVELAVALGAFVPRDDADGVVLVLAIDVLHVGAELGDVHPAVTVEGQIGGLT